MLNLKAFSIAVLIAGALFAAPDLAFAQAKGKASCHIRCDCGDRVEECLDFCGSVGCTTNSACKQRVTAMINACLAACRHCKSLLSSKKN